MEELRTPKVADSNVTIVADEHISRFDVMVDDAQQMERAQPCGLDRDEGGGSGREEARTSSTATSFILFSPRWVAQTVRSPIWQKSCDICLGEVRKRKERSREEATHRDMVECFFVFPCP